MVGRQPVHPPHLLLEIPPVAVTTAPAPVDAAETVELPVAPAEVRALSAVQRRLGAGPVVATARGMSHFGEHAGGWLALGLLGALVDRSRRRDWFTATAGVAAAHGASIAVKRVVRRPRPDHPRVQVLVGTPSRLSFPSAHATSTTAAAVLFGGLLGRRITFAVVPPMALSRLVLGVHYPTDVAAGALLGAGVAAATRRLSGRSAR
jgi:membrane-associated phospholipid phosphatase